MGMDTTCTDVLQKNDVGLEISEETKDGVVILECHGTIDFTTHDKLMAYINRIEKGIVRLVFDFRQVIFSDVQCIKCLGHAYKKFGENVVHIVMEPDTYLHRIFNIPGVGIMERIPTHQTLGDALNGV